MTSNTWAERRNTSARPKVCKAQPPKPQPPAPGPSSCLCNIVPTHGTLPKNVTCQWGAYNPRRPYGDPMTLNWSVTKGKISGATAGVINTTNNSGGTQTWKLLAGQAPATLNYVYTWSDGTTCVKSATFTSP